MNDVEPAAPSDQHSVRPSVRAVPSGRRGVRVPLAIASLVAVTLAAGGWLFVRANANTNHVALASTPKGVSVVAARAARYRPVARYIGTIEPWIEARLGPQFTSAYVDTVLVRPGAIVRRNQVVATLDCRDASAASKAVAMQARALETQQEAIAHQAARVGGLLGGGYVSADEAEQKNAESLSKQADLLATQARLLRAELEVSDCILRAPFDGEVADRNMDPGAFAHPGNALVSVIDRSTVRIAADVPESDFAAVAPDTPVQIHLLSTGKRLAGKIARRSPSADPSTRTVRFEVDLADPKRAIPVHTTAELAIEVGAAIDASEIPLNVATVRGQKASLFVVDGGVAHKRTFAVHGEAEGALYVDRALAPGSHIVSQGRALLHDGERVLATIEPGEPPVSASAVPASSDAARPATSPETEGRM